MTPEMILAWRTLLGISQVDAAKRLGVTPRHYHRLEKGQSPLTKRTRMLMDAATLQGAEKRVYGPKMDRRRVYKPRHRPGAEQIFVIELPNVTGGPRIALAGGMPNEDWAWAISEADARERVALEFPKHQIIHIEHKPIGDGVPFDSWICYAARRE